MDSEKYFLDHFDWIRARIDEYGLNNAAIVAADPSGLLTISWIALFRYTRKRKRQNGEHETVLFYDYRRIAMLTAILDVLHDPDRRASPIREIHNAVCERLKIDGHSSRKIDRSWRVIMASSRRI